MQLADLGRSQNNLQEQKKIRLVNLSFPKQFSVYKNRPYKHSFLNYMEYCLYRFVSLTVGKINLNEF